jgi:opacity protein-like surface antigen
MKKLTIAIAFLFVMSAAVLADVDMNIFTDYGVSYASVLTPSYIANNSTGTFDTAAFDIKVGASFLDKWAEIYAGAGFQPFIFTSNSQENYSFFPIYGGLKANICPDMTVYPDIIFEYGRAISNIRSQYMTNMGPANRDNAWLADYYSFGIGVNWKIEDIAILGLKIERPSYSNLNKSYGEIQVIKAGITWQIYY